VESSADYVPKLDGVHDAGYPPFAITLEDKRRWDLAAELAEMMFEDLDPGERRAQVWSATRVYYQSDSPTGEESERRT
jgi:hypothetical protein